MILRNLREGKGLFQECAKVQDTPIRCCFFHVIGILEEWNNLLGNSTRVIYIPTCFRKWLCFPLIALSGVHCAGNYCIRPGIR